ncbi:hypothetical protein OOT46_20145 [Aquabacterium sp. A7-Y]|uniref:hypothetical protein n=1 Tax=Aquabacterium sp. A7-Y TaxID=1349605 RepID=UPI00223DA3AA|nr:hypothetical protein [Aquabacterium sp. A7-Y]MCW7540149.1 hypothetical protein [Aquabacterium sp. A7-Y]
MTTQDHEIYSDDAVYQRSLLGQRALVFPSDSLSVAARRFLAMVNGHTPLRALLELGFYGDDMRTPIRLLLEQGLIEARELQPWCLGSRKAALLGSFAAPDRPPFA